MDLEHHDDDDVDDHDDSSEVAPNVLGHCWGKKGRGQEKLSPAPQYAMT